MSVGNLLKYECELFKKKASEKNIIYTRFSRKRNLFEKTKKICSKEYTKNNLQNEHKFLNIARIAKNNNRFIIPNNIKVFFVIRIKGINKVPPAVKKILALLRLENVNNGVFLKINPSTVQMLNRIDSFVAYGYPTLKTITRLIKKHGYCKLGKRGSWHRVSLLLNNHVIQQGLLHLGLSVIEDVVNEIYTCGLHFKEVNNFLWPFKLKSPKKGYSKYGKIKHITQSGACGNWEESINLLIKKMI